MKKNLVMCIATHYDWNALEPFVTSFNRNCPSADLVLFVDDISEFTRNMLIRGGVSLFDIPAEYKNVLVIHTRWKMYCDFLETHGDNYAQVFFTDVRDVIFQGDVFEVFKGQLGYLGYSTEADDIGGSKTSNKVNYNWLVNAFGKEEADKLVSKTIICCGTVIGTVNEMKTFCHEMWTNLQTIKRWGNEQATMNYFVHNNLLPIENLIKIDCDSGEILTAGLFAKCYPIIIRNNMLLRGDGGVPAVVHQYDRIGSVVALVNNVYRDKNFQADEKYSDTRSNLEQVWQLFALDRIDDALRFFVAKIAVGVNSDNNVDHLLRFWEKILKKSVFVPAVGYFVLSMQSALASVSNLSVEQLNTICARLNYSVKNGHIVAPQFVKFITRSLLNTSEKSFNAKYKEICAFCMETVNSLPSDKNLYLLQAEAYRALGKKEESLAAYSKALELS